MKLELANELGWLSNEAQTAKVKDSHAAALAYQHQFTAGEVAGLEDEDSRAITSQVEVCVCIHLCINE
jgi:hypothetical protein